jgi:hypothetical protein
MTAGSGILRFLHLGENSPTVFQITQTRFAQMHAAGGTDQQLRTNSLLQPRHRPGHAGCRQTQAPRGSGEALLLGNDGEDLHFLEAIHGALDPDKKIAAEAAILLGVDFEN